MKDHSLGVLGLGSQSTLYYLRKLNTLYNERNAEHSTCPFVMLNADFHEVNPHLPRNFKALEEPLHRYITDLKKLGVKSILIPNITIHEAIDYFYEDTHLFIHPLRETAERLKSDRVKECFLFGTRHTLESSYISGEMDKKGIKLMTPDAEDIKWIDRFRTKIYQGEHTENEVKTYHWLLDKYLKVAPIVVACTELSILDISRDQLYDMALIQIEQAIKIVG